jgi:hypothetical protein
MEIKTNVQADIPTEFIKKVISYPITIFLGTVAAKTGVSETVA